MYSRDATLFAEEMGNLAALKECFRMLGESVSSLVSNDEFLYASVLTMWIAVFAFWLMGIVHCLMNPRLRDIEKLTWIVVLLALNALGAAIYFAIGRNPRRNPEPS